MGQSVKVAGAPPAFPWILGIALLTGLACKSSSTSEVPFRSPPEVRSSNGVLSTELRAKYALNQLGEDRVYLRSYNGGPVGPTIRIRPGDVMKLHFVNELPVTADSPAEGGTSSHTGHGNTPNGFNLTNLHTHGLWVSPAHSSDNVLLTLHPGQEYDFEINVPVDHPPGTHWYHPHRHGSTALQVSSGMEGMLIIEGGLDDVPEIRQATEQVFVLQQVAYDSDDCSDVLPAELRGQGVGCIESYDNFGLGKWQQLGHSTTVNGLRSPTLTVRPGEVQRWRMVHGGVRESIHLALVRETEDGSLPGVLPVDINGPLNLPALVGQGLEVVPFHVIAEDGIAYGRIEERQTFQMEPGYRVDLLVKVTQPGTYRLVDLPADLIESLHPAGERLATLGRVIVTGEPIDMPLPSNESLAPLAPYAHVADEEITGCQRVEFNIDGNNYTVNGKSYDSDAPACKVPLNQAQEWRVSSKTANHPFHIHVNPFEVQRSGQPNLWKDTYLIRSDAPIGPSELTVLRTRYRRYTGKFVMHCHILDHEDHGMMEAVEVMENPPPQGSADSLCVACQ